ncbi:MAG: hypothetical protein PHQ61_07270, partial [Candidatus Omnitrophica bacterium]|nr:hypothetical protein [Candidatus Omnitrophota bacterium]
GIDLEEIPGIEMSGGNVGVPGRRRPPFSIRKWLKRGILRRMPLFVTAFYLFRGNKFPRKSYLSVTVPVRDPVSVSEEAKHGFLPGMTEGAPNVSDRRGIDLEEIPGIEMSGGNVGVPGRRRPPFSIRKWLKRGILRRMPFFVTAFYLFRGNKLPRKSYLFVTVPARESLGGPHDTSSDIASSVAFITLNSSGLVFLPWHKSRNENMGAGPAGCYAV